MTTAHIEGSIAEWQPFVSDDGKSFIFRRSNGDIVASIGAHELVETAKGGDVFRYDADARCFVPVNGDGPRGLVAKPIGEMPKSF